MKNRLTGSVLIASLLLAAPLPLGSAHAQRGDDTSELASTLKLQLMKASQLPGTKVTDKAGQAIGTVRDVMFNPNSGRAHAIIVESALDGTDGMRCLPCKKIDLKRDGTKIMACANPNDLRAAAACPKGKMPTRCMTSNVIGVSVLDAKGSSLGEIEELYLDPKHRMIGYAALGLGGVLGLGETWHSVPYRALTTKTVDGDHQFMITVPHETLKTMPHYPKDGMPTADDLNWHNEVHAKYSLMPYWMFKHGLLRVSELSDAKVMAPGAKEPCTVKSLVINADGKNAQLLLESPMFADEYLAFPLECFEITKRDGLTLTLCDGKELGNAKRIAKDGFEKHLAVLASDKDKNHDKTHAMPMLASQVVGKSIANRSGESLGEIEDLVVSPEDGTILYGVAGVGGVLGLGESLHALPWCAVQCNKDGTCVIDITEARLKRAPVFHAAEWPKLDDEWLDRVDAYYADGTAKP